MRLFKAFLLILALVLFQAAQEKPVFASPFGPCSVPNDCQDALPPGSTSCQCPQNPIGGKCLDSSRQPNGACVQPIPCVPGNPDPCSQMPGGQGDVCDPVSKTCVTDEMGRAGQSPQYADWIIGTTDKTVELLNTAGNNPQPSLEFTTLAHWTNFASQVGVGLAGGQDQNGKLSYGANGILVSAVYSMTTQPVISSKDYIADLGTNLGILPVTPAYAQGVGFNAFVPVLGLWKLFRDIAYLALVAIFIVVGFLVMFRHKIDPRTVVTIQDALPKIILAVILITFSYAIAGFLVDLGNFVTRLIGAALAGKFIAIPNASPGMGNSTDILDILYQKNIIELVNPLRGVADLSKQLGPAASEQLLPVQALAWVTIEIVFRIAAFFIMFKIFMSLLAPYISIILSVIFAPLQLLLVALPGNQGGLGSWMKGIIANIAVFPATFTMLALAAVFKSGPDLFSKCVLEKTAFFGNAPWCVGNTQIQFFNWAPIGIGNWGVAAGNLIAFGILFTIPKVTEMIQGALQTKPQPWAGAFGEEIKSGAGRVPIVGGILGSIAK